MTYKFIIRWYFLVPIFTLPLLAWNTSCGQSFNLVNKITKDRQALLGARSDSVRAKLCFSLADSYSVRNEDSATYFATQGITYAEKLPDKHILLYLYGELGRSYQSSGKVSEGLAILQKAEKISLSYVKDSTTVQIQLLLATFFTRQGDYHLALEKALSALRYYGQYKPDKRILLCKIYNALGIIYMELKDYKQAIAYLNQQKEVGKDALGGYYVYLSNINLFVAYFELGEFDKAETAGLEALAKAKEMKNNRGISFGLGNLAEVFLKSGRPQQAVEYAQQALQIRRQLMDKRLIGISLVSLSEIYQALHQETQALAYIQEGVSVLRTTSDRIMTQKALEIQSQLLEKMADFQAALAAYKLAKVIHDSLTNINNVREVSRIKATFDFERKENQIQLLNKNLAVEQLQATQRRKQLILLDNAKQASEFRNQLLSRQQQLNQTQLNLQTSKAKRQQILIAQQQTQLDFARQRQWLYLTILLLLMGLIGVISYFLNRQQQAGRLLSRQKEEIQQQAVRLAELNATKDKLFSLISHDLRGPVASIKNNLWQFQHVEQQPHLLAGLIARIHLQIDAVITLLTNLLDWSLVQLNGFQLSLRSISLHEVVEETLSQLAELSAHKQLGIFNQLDKTHWCLADKYHLQAVIRNILSNAIKFTPPGGFIRIYAKLEEGCIDLCIRDSGVGIGSDQLSTLFSVTEVRPGTLGELGTGLGLQICRDMIDRLGGQLYIDSWLTKGTLVRIRLNAASNEHEAVNH